MMFLGQGTGNVRARYTRICVARCDAVLHGKGQVAIVDPCATARITDLLFGICLLDDWAEGRLFILFFMLVFPS